jgi:catechol 2,3-dioxygenase
MRYRPRRRTGSASSPTTPSGINHFAIGYPTREAWLHQLDHLQANGIPFDLRGNHGMTHSVYVRDPDGNSVEILYDLPATCGRGDVNAALNYFEVLPAEGAGALEDDTEYHRFDPADA